MKAAWMYAFFALSLTSACRAESVRVQSGDASGQGWLFRDSDTGYCGVVTEAHLVSPGSHPMLSRKDGIEGVGADVQILSPPAEALTDTGLDVAVMRVEGAIASRGCSSSTLGAGDLSLTLIRVKRGIIERVADSGEEAWYGVTLAAEARSTVLGVRMTDSRDKWQQTDSGSTILTTPEDRESPGAPPLPLAMISRIPTGSETTIATAIRFDAIRRLVLPAIQHAATAKTLSAPIEVVDWSGETIQTECPATQIVIKAAPCGWRTKATGDAPYVRFVLKFSGDEPRITGVNLAIEGAPPDTPAFVETSSLWNGEYWTWITRCPISSDGQISCAFPQIVSRRLRITIPNNKATYGIKMIQVMQ